MKATNGRGHLTKLREHAGAADATRTGRPSVNVDRVIRRFFDGFRKEHGRFSAQIEGIPDDAARASYASILLSRLMFICFIQTKGFLNGDPRYLQTRLAECRRKGKDLYYREFIRPLFFDGLARPEARRPATLRKLLGRVPYLNGGVFRPHVLERLHGQSLAISDRAFDALFAFFETYRWHLDERPIRGDNEINPDVLGCILEKYINQRGMGAYYTKDDITGYIAQNTIIPRIFDIVQERCPAAFEGEGSLWKILAARPDRYIHPAMRKGVDLALPPAVAAGIGDVSMRGEWNSPAPRGHAHPTETWREAIERHRRCRQLRARIAGGEIGSINDFITGNIDIRRFAQDAVQSADSPDLLRAFWEAMRRVTVLDPTCGSGAFLFAAIDVFEPLYEACLDRMQALAAADSVARGEFGDVIAKAGRHPSRRYFVLKSIITSNLFGVDVMDEAVEICRLRLFLKLVAQVEYDERKPNSGIEPLPDIDLNIRAGNALVGFASCDEAPTAEGEKAGPGAAGCELDRRLAADYGIDPGNAAAFGAWLKTHRPFHWFIEFPRIMQRGGFDVVIGNPPYVEYSKVRRDYRIPPGRYATESTGNLYAFAVERGNALLSGRGSLGLIVPLSAFCTRRMIPLIRLVKELPTTRWVAHFGWRPAKLFECVNIPLSILISRPCSGLESAPMLHTTTFAKWYGDFREHLFQTISYVRADDFLRFEHVIPKIGGEIELSILSKLFSKQKPLAACMAGPGTAGASLYYRNTGGLYWRIITDFRPLFEQNGREMTSSTEAVLELRDPRTLSLAAGVLNSNLYWFFYVVFSSFHHLNTCDMLEFPADFDRMSGKTAEALIAAEKRLMQHLRCNSEVRLRVHRGGKESKAQTFFPSRSKTLVDDIDRVLADFYGLTAEEVDYVISYDTKYRTCRSMESAENQRGMKNRVGGYRPGSQG